ncbi:MAG TPA: hypothetical protein VGC09_06680 [Rhodopila sp.]
MLPGFRFLVAAVVLCLSMLVFGFGAASLLRSAHEEFANLPVRPSAPQTMFAQQQSSEAPPSLSMLRVETPQTAVVAPAETAVTIRQDSPALAAPSAPDPDTEASLRPVVPGSAGGPAAEPARSEPEPLEPGAAVETAAVATATPSPPAAEPAATEPAAVPATAPSASPDQPGSTLTPADAEIAATTIATLGDPPLDIDPVPLPKAKPAAKPVQKKARVRERAAKRRRLNARAEQTPPAAAPVPAETFGWQQPPR